MGARVRVVSAIFLWVFILANVAQASELAWYVDRPISQVSLEAPEGGLPDDNLEPLLKSQQGEIFSASHIRTDLATLYGTGFFSEVEAHVRPWVGFDEDGEARDEVWLIYRVIAATVVAEWRFSGHDHFSGRELALAAGIARGDRFLVEQEGPRAIATIERLYRNSGYPAANVTLTTEDVGDGEVALSFRIEEGPPRLLEEVEIAKSPALGSPRMRRIVRQAGLKKGKPFTAAMLEVARTGLEQAHRDAGWLEARVNAVLGAKNIRQVVFLIESGARLKFVSKIPGVRNEELREALGIRVEDRFRSSDLEDGRERIEARFRGQGWVDVEVEYSVSQKAGEKRIEMRADLGPRHELSELLFEGAELFSKEFLKSAAEEASPRVIRQGLVVERAVSRVRDDLVDLYEAKGYLMVQIEPHLTEIERNSDVVQHRLLFRIEEGPLVALTELTFSGVAEELVEEMLALKTRLSGQVVDHGALEKAVAELVERHREQGYLATRARIRMTVEPDSNRARAWVDVERGEQIVVRYVLVSGNQKTLRHIIEESVLLEVGDPVSPSLIAETRRKLYALGLFSTVEVLLDGDGRHYRDLLIRVREKPTFAMELGGGVATDLGVRGFTRVQRRNFFGMGHKVSALGEIGLGYKGDSWQLDATAPEWRAALRYDAPRFPSPSVAGHVDLLLNEREQEPTYRLGRTGGFFGVQLGGFESGVQISFGYRFFGHRLYDVDPGALVLGDPWIELLDLTNPEEVAEALPGGLRWESGPTFLALWDRRNDRFNPTRGTLMSWQWELTDPGVAEQITLRTEGQIQTVMPAGPVSFHVELGAGLGWTQGRSTTMALEKRFRMGGANSLRGFALDTVGPKNRVAVSDLPWPSQMEPVVSEIFRDNPVRWVPTGGDSMLRASFEVWTPLKKLGIPAPGTSLVAFVDAGNVFFTDPTILATSSLVDPEGLFRVGTGLGLRVSTPVGPVQIDWGVNPSYYTSAWAKERDEEPWRLHLSLGSL